MGRSRCAWGVNLVGDPGQSFTMAPAFSEEHEVRSPRSDVTPDPTRKGREASARILCSKAWASSPPRTPGGIQAV